MLQPQFRGKYVQKILSNHHLVMICQDFGITLAPRKPDVCTNEPPCRPRDIITIGQINVGILEKISCYQRLDGYPSCFEKKSPSWYRRHSSRLCNAQILGILKKNQAIYFVHTKSILGISCTIHQRSKFSAGHFWSRFPLRKTHHIEIVCPEKSWFPVNDRNCWEPTTLGAKNTSKSMLILKY